MLIDTHAHLDYPDFQPDFHGVLQRANEAGIDRIISIATGLESSRRVVELAEKYTQIYAVIGIHPNAVMEEPDDAVAQLRELIGHPKVVALGEAGLDYYRLPSSDPDGSQLAFSDEELKARQAIFFQQQLDLAVEAGLNLVVHERSAWEDTVELLKPYTGKLRAVFHCFGKSLQQAQELIAMNHLVSFTGIVTFKNAQVVQDTAASIPADAFMVETDCPYLAPIPFRGKRCEPAHTRLVAEKIAALRGEPLEKVAEQTTANAHNFFRFNGRNPA